MFNVMNKAPLYLMKNGHKLVGRLDRAEVPVDEAIAIMDELPEMDEDAATQIWLLLAVWLFKNSKSDIAHFELMSPAPDGLPFDESEIADLIDQHQM
ncbi:hypothetical protein [Neptunicoccus sediminis]|uniref:hypothetical protein n=1 Tax=Neptunicoccus sediminis TaxID=1892596 RepID=UPI000845FCD6|nr:hypothetical protein [Neptunicoccus sediminis]